MQTKTSPPFPLVHVSGTAFERGLQFGRACGDMIDRYPRMLQSALRRDALLRDPTVKAADLSRAELEDRALRFVPTFEEFAPDQLEELRGMAAGAEVPFATCLLVNVRGEIGVFDKRAEVLSGCTAFAVGPPATADDSVLVGQNQDQGQIARDLVVILRVEPDQGPRILMATFGGLLGYGGMNSAGVGMMQNQLANSSWRFGMPHYPLKRALLQQQSLSGCIEVFERAKLGSCANYVLVDKEHILDIEATPEGFAVLHGRAGCIAHANHFLDPNLAKDEQLLAALPDSADRNLRLNALLDAKRGHIDLNAAKRWLTDHGGFPTSICRHATSDDPTEISTMYSVICEVDKGLMHVAAGNPCENSFYTYSLN